MVVTYSLLTKPNKLAYVHSSLIEFKCNLRRIRDKDEMRQVFVDNL